MSTYDCPKKEFQNILTFSVWNVNQGTKIENFIKKQETLSVFNVNQATKDSKLHYKTKNIKEIDASVTLLG